MLIMLIYIEFCTEKKKRGKNHKAQWICENQVSDTGPLGLLFNVILKIRNTTQSEYLYSKI